MTTSFKFILGTACAALLAAPAMAEAPKVKTDTVTTVTEQSSTVAPDGSVTYQSETTVTRAPVKPREVTFYYYDPKIGEIVTGSELTDEMISLWDRDNNKVIDNHEFYTNALIVYEPLEYTKRTYQDVNGKMKLTKEEYTVRLQQLPIYRSLNTDGKEGLTLYEFTGVGFQDADHDNNNQVSYDELKTAFFAKEGLVRKPLKENP